MNFETKIDHKIPTEYILNTVCKSIITNMVKIQNFEVISNIFIQDLYPYLSNMFRKIKQNKNNNNSFISLAYNSLFRCHIMKSNLAL